MILPLQAKRNQLLKKEELEQRRLEMQFPQSAEEYRAMKHDDLQRRVARFLGSSSEQQEKIRDETKWAWRQTDALIKQYIANVSLSEALSNNCWEMDYSNMFEG